MQRFYIIALAIIVIVGGIYTYLTKLHHGYRPGQIQQRIAHNLEHLKVAVFMIPVPWADQLTCDEVKDTVRPYVPKGQQVQLDALSEPGCLEGMPKITKWQLRMLARDVEFFPE